MAINATAIWRVRPSGNNLNGGGYDPGIGGAATDYSQQNAAQASGSNATCATGTSTFVDATANAFTSAMVGNCIQIASGTNFTAGFYYVTAFTSASTVTLDRSPVGGTSGTAGVWKLGGGWADLTNVDNAVVGFNTVYVLGSGTPNPSSYVFDYTASGAGFNLNWTGASAVTPITVANDPATPGYKAPPDTTGGMPVLRAAPATDQVLSAVNSCFVEGLWLVANGARVYQDMMSGSSQKLYGCVFDINGLDTFAIQNSSSRMYGCEFFSSVSGSGGTSFMVQDNTSFIFNCNIHDGVGGGVHLGNGVCQFRGNIVAKFPAGTAGLYCPDGGSYFIVGNTIDGNSGHGIYLDEAFSSPLELYNNIITNHTGAGKFGLIVNTATYTPNLIDYNVFYNNTSNYSNITPGVHDTALVTSPYVNSSTENYTLA